MIEPHPGGRFQVTMLLPDGSEISSPGCVLLAEENRRLIFTDALDPGFRPGAEPFMTAEISFEPEDGGTRYTAKVLHHGAEACDRHEQMGFHEGWAAVAEQLAKIVER